MHDTTLLDRLVAKMGALSSASPEAPAIPAEILQAGATFNICAALAFLVGSWFVFEKCLETHLVSGFRLFNSITAGAALCVFMISLMPLLLISQWSAAFGDPLQFFAMLSLLASAPLAESAGTVPAAVSEHFRLAAIGLVKDLAGRDLALSLATLAACHYILNATLRKPGGFIPYGSIPWTIAGLAGLSLCLPTLLSSGLWDALDGDPEKYLESWRPLLP